MADVLKQKEQELKALEDRLRGLEEHASRVNNTGINVKTDGVSNLDRAIQMTMSDMKRLRDEIAVLNGSAQRELSEVMTAMQNIPEIKLNISNLTELKKTLEQLNDYNFNSWLVNIDGIDFKKLVGKGLFDGSNNLHGLNHFISETDSLGIDESTMNSVIQKNRDLIQMMVTDMHRELEASIKYVMNGDKEAVSSVFSDIQSKYSYSKFNTIDLFKGEVIKANFNKDYMQTAPLSIPGVDTHVAPKVDKTEAKDKIKEIKTEVDKIDDTPIVPKVDTTEAKNKLEEIKNKSVKVDATPITENGLGNTGLKQMHNILSKTTDDLTAYNKVFNNANGSVISNIEANGTSATDLRDKLNKLLSDAQGLSKLGNSININDQGQVDGFVAKIKELDRTLSDLSPVIIANLKEMNTAFQREFKLDDGTTGYLKEQLNELRAIFKDDFLKIDVARLAPDLSGWADKFVEQVNSIEYAMGRLTEFGKQRNETEKALGFVVSQKDIAPIQEDKRAKLTEYDTMAKGWGYSGLTDTSFLQESPEIAQDIESINIYIKQLDDAVGKKIKGYIELFNEAQNLLKGGQSNKELYETIGNQMSRSLYGDNIDWSKMTPSGLKELESGLGGDEFFGASSAKTAESIVKVEEASNKAVASVRNYAEELNKLVEVDKVLSSEQKQGILGQDFSDKIIKYGKDIEYFKGQLQSLGNTKLTDMSAVQLDPNKTEDFTALTNYKSRVNEAIDSLGILKEEQAKLFSSLSDPTAMSKMIGSGISQELLNEIKAVLESGYKVNLLDGSADKEKLDKLRAGFEQLISEFRDYNIDIIPDKEIEDLAKLNALQQAINTESRRQAETAQAQANYEKDKVRYLEQYNKIAQAQANIKALESTRNNLMTGASKEDKKAISERYATEIASNQSIVRSAEQTIAKYKAEFAKHNLEIPVTPVVKTNASLSGQFKSEFMGLKASGRNEILGGLSGQDATIAKLNQQAQALGLNVDKINTRLSATSNTIKTAFYSGDIERARSLMSAYATEVDKLKSKVEGQSKAQDIAKERQRQATQEAERNAKAQAKAAEEQARAQQKAADEAQKAAEKEKRAYEESLNAAKQKITQGLSAIKSFADGVNNAVNKIVSIIRTGIGLVNKVISGAGRILTTLGGGIKTIITLFGNLGNRIKQAFGGNSTGNINKFNGSINLLKGSVTELNSKITLLKNTFNALFNNEMVNKAKQLLSSIYSINTIGGKGVTDDVIKWANNLEYAFGLSARDLIADIQELNGVMYGLGMTAENSVLASQNLLMMGNYLASVGFAGGDVDQVISKLTSGMKGMTQAIDDLGLSVRDAQMDAFLDSLKAQGGEFANISTDFSSLNEEARVYIRYASLIKQFTDNFDITNFTKGLETVTGRVSLFKSAVSKLMTVLGTGLLNVFAKLTTYLIPIINLITNLISKLFAFFGISTELSSGMNGGDDLGGIGTGLDETSEKLDEVAKKADKAKGSLQGFDRVNNVTSSSGSSSSSGIGDDFDYSSLMTSMIDELNKKAEEAAKSFADSLHEKMMENLKAYKDKFIAYAKDITGRANFDLGFDWPAIKENLKKTIDNIKQFIISWGKFFITIGLKIADDINIGAIITKFTELVAKVTEVANVISKVLQPALDTFYEIGIKPIMEYLGVETLNVMDFFIDKLDELAKWFVDNEDTIIKFFEDLGEKVAQAFRVLTGQQTIDDVVTMNTDETGWGTFLNILDELPNKIKSVVDRVKELISILTGAPSLDAVVEMNSGSDWGNILTIISSLRDILGQLLDKLGEFVINEGLPWLQEKLNDLANWIKENKDKVVKLLDKVASIAWDGFKQFVDLVGKLIDFVVKNPDSVYGFFAGLLGLKVASWFADVATNIGLAVVGMEGFTKLISGGALGKLFGIGGAAATTAATATTGGAAASMSAIPMATTGATSLSGIPMVTTGAQSLSTLGATAAPPVAAAGGVAVGPIMAVIAAVVALIAVVKDLWDTSEDFRESVSNAWEYIKNAFNTAKEAIAPAIESLKEAWSTFYESYESSGLKDILDVILSFVVEGIGRNLSMAISTIGQAVAFIVNLLGDIIVIISGVIDAVSGFVKVIIGFLTLDGDMVKEGWGELVTGLVEIVSGLIQAIVDIIGSSGGLILDIGKNIFGGFFEGMHETWNTGIENVKAWFNSWIDSVKEFFGIHSPSTLFAEFGAFIVQGLLDGISNTWQTLVSSVTSLATLFVSSIKTVLLSIISAGAEIVTGILNGITSVWQTLVSGVTSLATSFINSVKTILLSITSVGSTIVNGIWTGINSAWSGLTSNVSSLCSNLISNIQTALSSGWNNITSWLSNVGQSISNGWNNITGKTSATTAKTVTSHAVGGSIAGGQLFIANENGQPELIGNIDGSPKTNVANNNMIIEAMTNGVFTGVYNALAEVSNQRGTVGGAGQNVNLKIDGFGLIDSSTLNELARRLAPYMNSNNSNIADINFSI